MTPEAQRMAIAAACKWNWTSQEVWRSGGEHFMKSPNVSVVGFLPDYLNDLNAMHEAEMFLTDGQAMEYERQLQRVWFNRPYRNVISAPAAQRAKAFLKTIGKWTE